MWGGHSFPPRTSSTGFHLRPGELVFVQFHVHLAAPEGDAFRLQPESLFEGIISAQLDGASGAQHSLPGQGDRASQSCYYLAGGARKSGSFCDSAIGGDLAARNATDRRQNLLTHFIFRTQTVSLREISQSYPSDPDQPQRAC